MAAIRFRDEDGDWGQGAHTATPFFQSRRARIGALVSFIWLVIVLVAALIVGADFRYFAWSGFLAVFLVGGVLPVTVGWLVRWKKLAKR